MLNSSMNSAIAIPTGNQCYIATYHRRDCAAKFELIQGSQLNDDPYVSLVPDIPNGKSDESSQQIMEKERYVQFVPICTSQNTTDYEYSISINDPKVGFDVYFVTSAEEVSKFLNGDSFSFYEQDECMAQNFRSYSGVCKNVSRDSGLMVILPDSLELSVTKVRISLHEL